MTIYLDKPMRNHTLMQTIARANRVFQDKRNGLIMDYIGVFRDLQKALAIYGSASGGGVREGETPVKDKEALVEQLRRAVGEAAAFCVERGIDLAGLQAVQGFERVRWLDDAVETILANDESKKKFLSLVANVNSLYRAILPDPSAGEFGSLRTLSVILAEKIRSLAPEVDLSDVAATIESLLDESITAEEYILKGTPEAEAKGHTVDLSQTDFDALKAHFENGRKHTEVEKLKSAISHKLRRMVRLNKSRMNYLETFQRLIAEYNQGSANIDFYFAQLTAFAKGLCAEEERGIAEQLSEEELALFDLLVKPDMALGRAETREVKKVARELLSTLKQERLIFDWRKRQQSRAAVRVSVEEILDRLPPVYTPEVYQQKCQSVYQHIYDSYYGQDLSVYTLTPL